MYCNLYLKPWEKQNKDKKVFWKKSLDNFVIFLD